MYYQINGKIYSKEQLVEILEAAESYYHNNYEEFEHPPEPELFTLARGIQMKYNIPVHTAYQQAKQIKSGSISAAYTLA